MSGNNNDDESVNVRGIAIATAAGVVLLIFIVLLFLVVLFHWTRKKSRQACSIDDKQQYTHTTAGLSQCDHHTQVVLSRKLKVEPISRLETINGAYISTHKVKSLDSLLRQHSHNESVCSCDVTITLNPSYDVALNTLQTNKEPEQLEYDYTNDDLLAASAASGGACGKANYPVNDDDVNITPNPSYSLPQDGQDVILEDNPCYA